MHNSEPLITVLKVHNSVRVYEITVVIFTVKKPAEAVKFHKLQ